jgi:tetratricopeptide (TPR) repeat protein
MKAIRDYRQSERYKDSVTTLRQHRQDSLKASREHQMYSIRNARKQYTDSLLQVRQHYNDSIKAYMDSLRVEQQKELALRKAAQQKRSDSLKAIRDYRTSEPYKDSIAAIRQHRIDSMTMARKHYSDSVRTVRTAMLDSMKAARKKSNDSLHAYLDSMRVERQRQIDSMATVRQARKDSLAKVKAARDAAKKEKIKEKEKNKELKLEIKFNKKKKAYTNEAMRKKKWSLPRQVIQNTFTRYNYYFNTDKKMDEAIDNMLRSKTDNFDSLISIFPFNPDVDSAKLASDMDTIIRKASLGIEIHDPRAKWQGDLYLLVGQAYFYKADYENAGAAFKQIVVQAEEEKKAKNKKQGKDKDKNKPVSYSEPDKTGLAGLLAHQSVKNEAILWLARTLTQSKKEGQAQTLLDMLRNDANFPDRLKGRLALEQAFIEVKRENYKAAVAPLSAVSADKDLPQWLRLRSAFLTGQILQGNKEYDRSNEFFKTTISLHPKIEMDFYARKNIAFNDLKANNDPGKARELLQNMIDDGKYRPYLDQIYFALAKANLNSQDIPKAIENLKKSIQYSQNNKKQKGYSFAALGDQYYNLRDYNKAKLAYDSAAMFLTADQNPVYDQAKTRSVALSQIAGPAAVVAAQDSLLHLASLSEKEQRGIIKDYLKALRKHLSDSLFLAENGGNKAPSTIANPLQNQGGQSWYFSNPVLVQKGLNEFKQKWGDRKLADNWRRSSGLSAFAGANNAGETDDAASNDPLRNLPDEDSLYAAIPHTPEALQAARETLAEGLFLLGKGYYTYLEDFDNALSTFDTLDLKFPGNKHQAEVLYDRYLMSMRRNEKNKAQQYNNKLQQQFPESEWAKLLAHAANGTNIASEANTLRKKEISDYYDETYRLLTERQYDTVLQRVDSADKKFPDKGDYEKRYTLIKAVAIAGTGNYPTADSMLTAFVKTNPTDSLVPWANSVLDFIKGKEPNSSVYRDSVYAAGQAAEKAKLAYIYQPGSIHFVIILAPADMRLFALKSGLQDYNLMTAGRKGVTVNMTTFDPAQNMVLCKQFPNAKEARKYAEELRKNKTLFREYPSKDFKIIIISSDNFTTFTQKTDVKDYEDFYTKNYK